MGRPLPPGLLPVVAHLHMLEAQPGPVHTVYRGPARKVGLVRHQGPVRSHLF